MRQSIIFSLICALMLIASNEALSSERTDKHRYKAKSEFRDSRHHHKKHRRQHRYSHQRHHRKHKHRRNNDAAIFIGGALLGAALNSHHNHHSNHRDNYRHSYTYRRDRRGDCFRVEYKSGKEIWFSVPRRHCQVY